METTRYCLNCEKFRTFRLDTVVGHSRWVECAGRYSAKKKPDFVVDKEHELITNYYQEIIHEKDTKLKEKNLEIEQLRKQINKVM